MNQMSTPSPAIILVLAHEELCSVNSRFGVHTGSTTVVVTWCLRSASATTSIEFADASIPIIVSKLPIGKTRIGTSLDYISSNVFTHCINLLL